MARFAVTALTVGVLLVGLSGVVVFHESLGLPGYGDAGSVDFGGDDGTAADRNATDAAAVPGHGAGTFIRAEGGAEPVGSGTILRYRVEVEDGIGQDPTAFASRVDRILADPRGWTAGGRWGFVRPEAGPVDFVVVLASPSTVDEICARYWLETNGEASCRGGANVVINLKRWQRGIPAFRDDVDSYRHLVVNHEVGHFLGYGHMACPGEGMPAPVMQTQMYGLDGCRPNAWPYRDGSFVEGPPVG